MGSPQPPPLSQVFGEVSRRSRVSSVTGLAWGERGAGVPDADEDALGVAAEAELDLRVRGGLRGVDDELAGDEQDVVEDVVVTPLVDPLGYEGAGEAGRDG